MKQSINGEKYDIKPFADLQSADLQNANLQKANLQWAYLQRVNLQDANLRGADLQWAYLQWANLQRANLQKANLRGVNLRGAHLQGAGFTDAIGIVTAGQDHRGYVFYKQLKNGKEIYGAGCCIWESYEDAIGHYTDGYGSDGDPAECVALVDNLKDMVIKTVS